MAANYKLIALQVGDLIKYHCTEKEINRAAQSVFNFNVKHIHISESVSSLRAKTFANWVLTLALEKIELADKNSKLQHFIEILLPAELKDDANKLLVQANILEDNKDFDSRNYHNLIIQHAKPLFQNGHFFHAVFEAAKVYNKYVQQKSHSLRDGQDLMMNVLSLQGCLKVNTGQTGTDKNVQEGIKFLSAGLMQAMRNPTAHEPAIDWPISKQDCLDMLSFVSYLFRQIDNSIKYENK
ncbi:MAG: TIGR02391 family protein [Bacteroidaceae bacterium]